MSKPYLKIHLNIMILLPSRPGAGAAKPMYPARFFPLSLPRMELVGKCNGIFCVNCLEELWLWNPIAVSCTKLPFAANSLSKNGMGDEDGRMKIVQVTNSKECSQLQTYSIEDNVWAKSTRADGGCIITRMGINASGDIFWMFKKSDGSAAILGLSLVGGTTRLLELPISCSFTLDGWGTSYDHLGIEESHDGILFYEKCSRSFTIHILDRRDAWIKEYSVPVSEWGMTTIPRYHIGDLGVFQKRNTLSIRDLNAAVESHDDDSDDDAEEEEKPPRQSTIWCRTWIDRWRRE